MRPDTDPAIDTPEVLEYITRRATARTPVNIRAMAALTRDRAGREMAEISFLLDAGAVAFTDGDRVSTDTKVLSRCMAYARGLGALVIGHPQDPGLSKGACATSGKFASLRGLPAVSPMAERMGFDRDMGLVEMTGVRYHADQITSARTLPALTRAKANGAGCDGGHFHSPPDVERTGCRQLPQLFSNSPRRCGQRTTAAPWCKRWPRG